MSLGDFFRDTLAWHVLRVLTGGKPSAFQYFDERHPLIRQRYISDGGRSGTGFSQASRHTHGRGYSIDTEKADNDIFTDAAKPTTLEKYGMYNAKGVHLVEFLPNDPENPRNWCKLKKAVVGFQICLLIVTVYAGASIYTVSIDGVKLLFHVTPTIALLGLSFFVLGYGVGPLLWSPLSEIYQIGRNFIYIPSLVIFIGVQVPAALATNIYMLLALRFAAGFFGSPVLGSAGGILADIFVSRKHTYAMVSFALIGICGPTIGPIIGGFAVEAKGWEWSFWIISWLGTATLASLIFLLPETSADNILYRRTIRLRNATGDGGYVCEAQLRASQTSAWEVTKTHFIRPFTLTLSEPAVFFLVLYTSFVYGLMYIWFESLPLAYMKVYHFDLGTRSLALLGLIAGVLVIIPPFFLYYRIRIEPKFDHNGKIIPEKHLHPAMIGCLLVPGSLVWFGWTAKPENHFAIPIVGSALFSAGAVLLYISILNYLSESYPDHISSVLAGHELFTSMCGASFPLFVPSLYYEFDVFGSSIFLAIFAVAFVPLPFIIYLVRRRPSLVLPRVLVLTNKTEGSEPQKAEQLCQERRLTSSG
ncbi:Transporter mfs1-like protein 2 [Colletotrichum chlorophyti]|uniref:Transporter mfs1-like protein 2 n=1 Tax=Colletotrichum chlorophyti TaxID=708187 RepID=A0A1Q8RXZ8_9PEZI|nr:Transporter mfs1-like protein 2 [Colletotrichum chlorophyti]